MNSTRGHVRKRGKTWSAIYDEGQDENGKRVQRWKGGFETRRDAQRFLTDALSHGATARMRSRPR